MNKITSVHREPVLCTQFAIMVRFGARVLWPPCHSGIVCGRLSPWHLGNALSDRPSRWSGYVLVGRRGDRSVGAGETAQGSRQPPPPGRRPSRRPSRRQWDRYPPGALRTGRPPAAPPPADWQKLCRVTRAPQRPADTQPSAADTPRALRVLAAAAAQS